MTDRLLERSRLAELEAVVERGMQTFVEVGSALMEIRDERLYRETHGTFERYLAERWGLSRAHGYRMIEAAHVAELVSPTGDIPPNERQARELVPLLHDADETAVVEVWNELRDRFGEQVTADRIRRLVTRRLERVEREQDSSQRAALVPARVVYGDVEIQHADFRSLAPDLDGRVDAIVTDPPYERSEQAAA